MNHDSHVEKAGIFQWLAVAVISVLTSPLAVAQDALFVDAEGDVGIGTSTPVRALHVVRDGQGSTSLPLRLEDPGGNKLRFVLVSGANTWTFDNAGNAFNISKVGSGINELRLTDTGNLTIQGTLNQGSSRTIKEAIEAIDPASILARLAQLPVSQWQYVNGAARHLGPMAEDFHELFGLGSDDRHVSPADMAGVAMASAQALNERLEANERELGEKQARIERLESQNAELRQRIEELASVVDGLAAQMGANAGSQAGQ